MGTCRSKQVKYEVNQNTVVKAKSLQNTTMVTSDISKLYPDETLSKLNSLTYRPHMKDLVRNRAENFLNEFEVMEELGFGSYGKVMKARSKRYNQLRAVKVLRKDLVSPKNKESLLTEVRVLLNLDHPNIMKMYVVFEDTLNYYIVSELLTGGEVFDRIIENKHLTEPEAASIMKQVLSAVAYCHDHNIVHRDLKPDNLLFDTPGSCNIKIIDFGLAQAFRPNEVITGVEGTSLYMAPEVFEGKYDEKCDVWSCGVILYVMLSGLQPFKGEHNDEIINNIKHTPYHFNYEVWDRVSDNAKNFIKRLMNYDPKTRISAREALTDPWFNQVLQVRRVSTVIAQDALSNLSTYKTNKKLQEAAWVFLATVCSSREDLTNLFETFKSLDNDNDGQLTKTELMKGYIEIMYLSEAQAEKETNKIFESLDTDHDGKIDYSEFCIAATSRTKLITEDRLKSVFSYMDKDGRGYVNAEDLKRIFNRSLVERFSSDNIWNRWIAEVDKNQVGKFTYEDFKEMMYGFLQEPGLSLLRRTTSYAEKAEMVSI